MANDHSDNDPLRKLISFIESDRNLKLQGEFLERAEQAVRDRMKAVDAQEPEIYRDYLQARPAEFQALLELTLSEPCSISADSLWSEIAPRFARRLGDRDRVNLRSWIVGCTSGFEAYSLAIAFAEMFGLAVASSKCKIFATAIDDKRLSSTRHGLFSEEELCKRFSKDQIEKYFIGNAEKSFRPDLRRAIIFGRHDVVKDPAITRMDLIICRGVLPYLNQEVQQKICRSLLTALNESGILVLDTPEQVPAVVECKILSSTTNSIYQRDGYRAHHRASRIPDYGSAVSDKQSRLIDAACDISLPATVCISVNGLVASINAQARSLFNLAQQDIGRPLQDLEISYRPVELRSLIELAYKQNTPLVINRISRVTPSGKNQILDVHVEPLSEENIKLGVNVQFHDVTGLYTLQDEVGSLNHQLQTANEELQSAHEELETTNEELQSTNEELETTNEELQSTNEELETMNEELQSTNTELEYSNQGQRELVVAVDRVNSFLQAVLGSMLSAIFVIDESDLVTVWNTRCQKLWGLREDEVLGNSLSSLDMNFPLEALREPFERLRKGGEPNLELLEVDAINRRGMPVHCVIKVIRMDKPGWLIVVIDDEPVDSQKNPGHEQ